MNVKLIRLADRYIGVPACAIATVLSRIGRMFAHDRADSCMPRNILFIKLAEQGASVLAYPAILRAIELVGRENVFFMVFDVNLPVLEAMDVVPAENIFPVSSSGGFTTIFDSLAAVRALRKCGIDTAIDLEFFARATALFAWMSGAKNRIGFHSFFGEAHYRGDLMTHRLVYNPHLHATRMFRSMVEASLREPGFLPAFNDLPGKDPLPLPVFNPHPEETGKVQKLLEIETGTPDFKPLILLNANASDLLPLRRWPEERYIELAKRILAAEPKARVAFTGGAGEAEAASALARATADSRCFSLAGKTNFRELLTLYCMANAMVTNDSGPAHFAAMTPLPTVTLFGPETPRIFGSPSTQNLSIWKELPCSPCVSAYNDRQSACRNNLCMCSITVEEVFQAVCGICRFSRT